MAVLEARSSQTRETILSTNALYPLGVGGIIGMVGGLRLERWAPSRRNDGPHQIGIGGRLTSESAAVGQAGRVRGNPTPVVVERTFGWMIRWRRLVRDYKKRLDVSEAMIHVAMGSLLLRRIAHQ